MSRMSISHIIGGANGKDWMKRREYVANIELSQFYKGLCGQQSEAGLRGQAVYANSDGCKDGEQAQQTNYDIVNAWQVNYVRGMCTIDGALVEVSEKCWSDDTMFGRFYRGRPGSKVLDVGCNTGKNMRRALQYGGGNTEVCGFEYSPDSAAVAWEEFGKDRVFLGDAASDFVAQHGWMKCFTVVQCTAVLQHMTPEQVDAAMSNMAKCLEIGGELLLTFKDAPTKHQLETLGMGAWTNQVFSADLVDKEAYQADGFLRAVMWDDDYYAGVTSNTPAKDRNTSTRGIHCREFVFYSLDWMTNTAAKYGLFPKEVEVMPDSKIPLSAFHWMIVFQRRH